MQSPTATPPPPPAADFSSFPCDRGQTLGLIDQARLLWFWKPIDGITRACNLPIPGESPVAGVLLAKESGREVVAVLLRDGRRFLRSGTSLWWELPPIHDRLPAGNTSPIEQSVMVRATTGYSIGWGSGNVRRGDLIELPESTAVRRFLEGSVLPPDEQLRGAGASRP